MRAILISVVLASLIAGRPLLASEQQDLTALRALDQAYATEWLQEPVE